VDGFVATGDKPLNQYERAFYQFTIDVLPRTGGGTIVRVTAKITAWYADKDPAKSGYQVLPSNGRLELDLLDRLEEKFGGKPASSMARALSNSTISAPKPKLDLGPSLVCKFRRRQILRQNPEPRQMNWARCGPIVKPKKNT